MGSYSYFHISTLPRIHSIVWCRLPDEAGNPGATVGPALVRGSQRHAAKGRSAVLVCYGTKSLKTTERGTLDLIIQNNARLYQLDLPHAVRFDPALTNWLPWAEEFFSPPQHSASIVAGALVESEKSRLRIRLKRRGLLLVL